jgi:hypothetical protein
MKPVLFPKSSILRVFIDLYSPFRWPQTSHWRSRARSCSNLLRRFSPKPQCLPNSSVKLYADDKSCLPIHGPLGSKRFRYRALFRCSPISLSSLAIWVTAGLETFKKRPRQKYLTAASAPRASRRLPSSLQSLCWSFPYFINIHVLRRKRAFKSLAP